MKRLAIAALCTLIAAPAIAADTVATLSRADGTVRVNQGSEFVDAVESLRLQAGDRIMTMSDGRAIVTFLDGCELEAGPNTLITVPELSTCAGGLARAQNIAPAAAEPVGAGSGFNWRTALLIAIPVAGAAAVIIDNNNDDDSPSVSP
jgi:hypothetical protein